MQTTEEDFRSGFYYDKEADESSWAMSLAFLESLLLTS